MRSRPIFSRSTASGSSTGAASRPASDHLLSTIVRYDSLVCDHRARLCGGAGYGTPLYKNIGYYFKVDPPFVMGEPDSRYTTFKERNAVSSYRRTFRVPEDWEGRTVYLRFEGFASAINVWLNGERLGYAEDGRQGVEFNITDSLTDGDNTLAVEVYRLCDGSYMEDQDFWRLSGLIRPVYLWSTPQTHLRDFFVRTTPLTPVSTTLHGISRSMRASRNPLMPAPVLEAACPASFGTPRRARARHAGRPASNSTLPSMRLACGRLKILRSTRCCSRYVTREVRSSSPSRSVWASAKSRHAAARSC